MTANKIMRQPTTVKKLAPAKAASKKTPKQSAPKSSHQSRIILGSVTVAIVIVLLVVLSGGEKNTPKFPQTPTAQLSAARDLWQKVKTTGGKERSALCQQVMDLCQAVRHSPTATEAEKDAANKLLANSRKTITL